MECVVQFLVNHPSEQHVNDIARYVAERREEIGGFRARNPQQSIAQAIRDEAAGLRNYPPLVRRIRSGYYQLNKKKT